MSGTGDPRDGAAFGRAFLCAQYLTGTRGGELALAPGLAAEAVQASERLLAQLRHPERSARARALAFEVAQLSLALQQRSLG